MAMQGEKSGEHYCLFDTALGVCGLAWSERGITRVQLPDRDRAATERRLRTRTGRAAAEAPPPAVQKVVDALTRYMAGAVVDFGDVAIDWVNADAFQRAVYNEVRRVGWGETVTYGELARRIGAPGEAQAVGQAMGRNPVPVIMPCHRVLASGGKLGGFSAYGGTLTKERLLALEGAANPRLPGF